MRVGVGLLVFGSSAGVLFAAACSSFGSGEAASTSDAAVEGAAVDAAPAPLVAENFDTDSPGCPGTWKAMGTTSVDAIPDAGTDGSVGCRICSNVAVGSFFSLQKSLGPASGIGSYSMEANMRIESGSAGLSAAFDVGGFNQGSTVTGQGWHHVAHVVSPEAGTPVTAEAAGRVVSAPACVVIDDIVVRKID
jgi:hypothetical protein